MLQEHTSRSEFLRRTVIARLREIGIPLELELGKAEVQSNEIATLKTERA